ncbi:helix-turn-helix transcriptional regulator [Pseudarthrobacter sp. N5]|uniref:helix-turn-helix transcriptional regulator n=1 Tax=Pseudarthrobacter sp. N5 TaxID=3418416 RepID=UPI003CFA133B
MTSELLAPAELGQRLGKSTAVLANWRYLGAGPKFIKCGKSIRYRVADIEAWLDQQTRQQTDAA